MSPLWNGIRDLWLIVLGSVSYFVRLSDQNNRDICVFCTHLVLSYASYILLICYRTPVLDPLLQLGIKKSRHQMPTFSLQAKILVSTKLILRYVLASPGFITDCMYVCMFLCVCVLVCAAKLFHIVNLFRPWFCFSDQSLQAQHEKVVILLKQSYQKRKHWLRQGKLKT